MPIEFLTEAQVAAYGRFAGTPTRAQLERFFFLDDADRRRVDRRRPGPRRDSHRLGFALQLGTVRFLGTFLADALAVPAEAVAYVAAQLGIADPSCLAAYPARAMTAYEHTWEIRRGYGYREFAAAEGELRAFLAARAWTAPDGPRALFDRATAWLLEHKVLLPGATTLARVVVAVRAEVAERVWRTVAGGVSPEDRARLAQLLAVDDGARTSALERLRAAPARVSGPAMVQALERVAAVRRLGAGVAAPSGVPATQLRALARYGMGAKVPQLRQLSEPRRTATLAATVQHLERVAIDEALDLLEVVLATKLFARAERESRDAARETARAQLRTLARFAAASTTLAAAVHFLLDATAVDDTAPLAAVWAEIERVVPRREVAAALASVVELIAAVPAPDEDAEAARRAEVVAHYGTVRPFLPRLPEVLRLGAVAGGQGVLEAVRRLPGLLRQRRVRAEEVTGGLVTGSWRRLVYGPPASPTGETETAAAERADQVNRRAYACCVVEHLHRALRRRDVFADGADRWGDPRARLLAGAAWARAKPEVLTALGLPEAPRRTWPGWRRPSTRPTATSPRGCRPTAPSR